MNSQPPKYPLRFFRWFCHPDYVEDIEGDLMERFAKRTNDNRPARWLFTLDVLRLFRPGIIRNFEGTQKLNHYGMFKHYLLITFRSFKKEKSYTAINLIGLTVSLCSCLLIWQYVRDQKAFDSYHENLENKYRVNYSFFEGEELRMKSAITTFGLGEEVAKGFTGIKNMVRVRPTFSDEGLVISNENRSKNFLEFGAYYVESTFLKMYNYPLKEGSIKDALTDPNKIVLTQETAKKFFGSENPIGQQLRVSGGSLSGDFIVSGVLEDLPGGTHFDFDYLIPIDFLLTHYGLYTREDGWKWTNFYTYFELEENVDLIALSNFIDALIDSNIGQNLEATNQTLKTSFQPLRSIYLDAFIDGDGRLLKGSQLNLRTFSLAAIVILIIAGINYINLASGRALNKGKEVLLRKAIGANRRQMISQFLFESLIFNIIAFGIASGIAYLLAPTFGLLIGTELLFTLYLKVDFWIILAAFLFMASVLTGLQPALLSLRTGSLRGKITVGKRTLLLRKSLITFQLMISLVLIAGTWLVYQQLSYMKSKELGVKMDQLFVVQGSRAVVNEGSEIAKSKFQAFKNTLMSHSAIQAACGSSNVPGTGEVWYGGVRKLGDPRHLEQNTKAILVDKEFTRAYDFEFLAGGPFHEGMTDYEAVIINQSALKAFGLKKPSDALAHSIVLEDIDTLKIHGVVKDVHWNSLHEPISPTIYGIVNMFNAFFSIKLSTTDLPKTLELIEDTYRNLYPYDPYISFFLDDEFNRQYQSEQHFGQVVGAFSILAIVISGLGLFALVSFSLSQKVKEIGIRKVLGATGKQLFRLLSKEYAQVFLIALAIASPILFVGSKKWLDAFAYRISIGVDLFAFPALLIAILTFTIISGKIWKAMQIDPAEQLRDE